MRKWGRAWLQVLQVGRMQMHEICWGMKYWSPRVHPIRNPNDRTRLNVVSVPCRNVLIGRMCQIVAAHENGALHPAIYFKMSAIL